ncbi:flagellar basal body-associated FliL family protein [Pararhizobium mangrovi]|uniref:Flagellar protein FliL n=1 Tax=Pararhizobium mangrovi TaxID=2590452 RepID=A0A506TXT9_9HYPH|nr:flagellar basal body-associated FliL family protein [Pararhizobium mangrovi]TPW26893.1 flagellar basal body-associated FliL family protein [Pararhizobium mangrovi]
MAGKKAEKSEGKGGKGSLVVTLAAVGGLSLLAVAGGFVLGGMLAPEDATAKTAPAAAHGEKAEGHGKEEAEGDQALSEANAHLVALDPMTTNLAYPADTWVRLAVSLVFKGEPDTAEAEAIHNDLMAYMRTVSLQQISGPRGFENLRNALGERAKLRSKGKVDDVLVRTFVIQ